MYRQLLINAKLKTGKKGDETEVIGRSAAKANSHFPCRVPAVLCRGLEKSFAERHGRSTAWAWHGKCESNMAALCKSNGKDTF